MILQGFSRCRWRWLKMDFIVGFYLIIYIRHFFVTISASFSFIIFLKEKIPKLRCDIHSRKDKSYRCHDLLHDTIVCIVYPLVRFFGVAFCVSTESRGVIDGSPNLSSSFGGSSEREARRERRSKKLESGARVFRYVL